MKQVITVVIVLTFFNYSFGQKLKKRKVIDPKANTFELYHVFEDQNIKQGDYLYRYQGRVQVKGQFDHNLETGQWIYTPGSDIKIIGNLKEGKRDGEWKYYKGKDLISSLNYKEGLLEGEAKGYFENGEQACICYYRNDSITGEYKSYYKNGKVKEIINYNNGEYDGAYQMYNDKGELVFKIVYKQGTPFDIIELNTDEALFGGDLQNGTGKFVRYALDQDNQKFVKQIRNYKDGKLHGQVKEYDHRGNPFYRGQYMKGYMVGMWVFDMDKEKEYKQLYHFSDSIKTDTTKWFLTSLKQELVESGVKPRFNNKNEEAFRYHIQTNLSYPVKSNNKGVSGRVITAFTVDQLGLVKDIRIVSSGSSELDQEAIRVIRSSPLWVPGFKNQLPVNVRYTFPIVFKL